MTKLALVLAAALIAVTLWYLVDGRYSYTYRDYSSSPFRLDRLTGVTKHCNRPSGC